MVPTFRCLSFLPPTNHVQRSTKIERSDNLWFKAAVVEFRVKNNDLKMATLKKDTFIGLHI